MAVLGVVPSAAAASANTWARVRAVAAAAGFALTAAQPDAPGLPGQLVSSVPRLSAALSPAIVAIATRLVWTIGMRTPIDSRRVSPYSRAIGVVAMRALLPTR